MAVFKVIVWVLGAIAILTGANDLLRGGSVEGDFGALGELAKDPTLNFTVRFQGAIWMGFGALLILFASNVAAYRVPLACALCIVIVGGLGRVASIVQLGRPAVEATTLYMILGIELVLVPALLVWHLVRGPTGS